MRAVGVENGVCIRKGKEAEEAEAASHFVAEAVQVGMCDLD